MKKNEKITIKVLSAIGFVASAICYFFPFVKIEIGSSGDTVQSFLELFLGNEYSEYVNFSPMNVLKMLLNLREEFDEVTGYIVLAVFLFVIPFVLSITSAILVFVLKPKLSGVLLCCTAGYGMLADIALRILLAKTKIETFLISVSLDELFSFDSASYINFILFSLCLIAAIALIVPDRTDGNYYMNGQLDPQYYDTAANDYRAGNYYNNGDYPVNNGDYPMNGEIGYAPPDGPTRGIYYYGDDTEPGTARNGYAEEDEPTVSVRGKAVTQPESDFRKTVGYIVCEKGMYAGTSFPVGESETLVLGRDSKQCNIVLDENDLYIGRRHCEILFDGQRNQFFVKACSVNGVKLKNGKKIEKDDSAFLPRGTTVYLGSGDNVFNLR